MVRYCAEVWRSRFFWMSLVRLDLRTQYSHTILGMLWSLLNPLAMMLVLCTVFRQIFSFDVREYGAFLLVGLAFWNYITTCCVAGAGSLQRAESYLRAYPAPMIIYPLRTTICATYHLVVTLAMAIVLDVAMCGVEHLPGLPALVPGLALLFILGLSLTTLCALGNIYFPDLQHLLQVALQILFYLTPILYPPAILAERNLGWINSYNPLGSVLALIRDPIVQGVPANMDAVMFALPTVCLVALAAFFALARLQRTLVLHL